MSVEYPNQSKASETLIIHIYYETLMLHDHADIKRLVRRWLKKLTWRIASTKTTVHLNISTGISSTTETNWLRAYSACLGCMQQTYFDIRLLRNIFHNSKHSIIDVVSMCVVFYIFCVEWYTASNHNNRALKIPNSHILQYIQGQNCFTIIWHYPFSENAGAIFCVKNGVVLY